MTQDYVALMDELKTGQRDKITVTPKRLWRFGRHGQTIPIVKRLWGWPNAMVSSSTITGRSIPAK